MGRRSSSAFLLAISLLLYGCEKKQAEPKNLVRTVKVFHVEGPEDIAQRTFPGIVDASDKVDLSFQVPGQIKEFPVKEGDQVKKGQLIAKLDPTDYEIAVGEAKSKLESAQAELERTKKLLAKQFASQKQYDANKTATDTAQAQLDLAQQNLRYTQITAPYDGEVAKKYVENFQNVIAKKPIVRLQNRKNLDIKVQIPESLVIRSDRFKQGAIEAEFETAPGVRYKVDLKEVGTQANVETQTYPVTFTLPAPKNLTVLPGMTAVVHAQFALPKGEKELFIIPITAVFNDRRGVSYVWLIEPSTNKLKKQQVKVGRLTGTGASITEGLTPGENIVAAGAEFLEEGMVVRPFVHEGS